MIPVQRHYTAFLLSIMGIILVVGTFFFVGTQSKYFMSEFFSQCSDIDENPLKSFNPQEHLSLTPLHFFLPSFSSWIVVKSICFRS